MANRIRIVEEAARRIARAIVELGVELRDSRLAAGLRQIDVARALGWSAAKVGRIERGEDPSVSAADLAQFTAVVGLRYSGKFYPAAGRLRDEAQLAMQNRFAQLIRPGIWSLDLEDPIPAFGDLRAFDLCLRGVVAIGTEFISRLRDVQAQVRPIIQKKRDSGIDRLLLVILDGHANRVAVRDAGAALSVLFPIRGKAVLAALRGSRDPGGNCLMFLRPDSPRSPAVVRRSPAGEPFLAQHSGPWRLG